MLCRPDLSMWVRVAGAHHRATVFEDLHVVNVVTYTQFEFLGCPDVHDVANRLDSHRRECEVMARIEAEDTTHAALRSSAQEPSALNVELCKRSEERRGGKEGRSRWSP